MGLRPSSPPRNMLVGSRSVHSRCARSPAAPRSPPSKSCAKPSSPQAALVSDPLDSHIVALSLAPLRRAVSRAPCRCPLHHGSLSGPEAFSLTGARFARSPRLRSSCHADARPLGTVSDPQAYRSPPRASPSFRTSKACFPSYAPGRRSNDLVRLLRTARRRRSPERPTVTAASLDCSPASSPAVSRSRISLALSLATVARFASQTRFALAR